MAVAPALDPDVPYHEYDVDDAPLRNPERGLVQRVHMSDPRDIAFVADELGLSLAIAQVRLDAFTDQPLSAAFLRELDAGFDRIRAAGLKVVLRFQYNSGSGLDPDVPRVLEHIAQLEPVLRRNADVIAVMQAGFIGAWGEWHSSTSGLDAEASRRIILRRLLAALPASRAVQVRSPAYKAQALDGGPLTAATAHDGSDLARVGHHNDCALFGDSDRGTYPPPIETWRAYLDADSEFTPVGGETCGLNPPRTNCGHAVHELRRFGWSYLNRAYHPAVLDTWQTQGCLDTIARDLGYRLIVRRASWPRRARPGERIDVRVVLENLGYAPPYNPRDVAIVVGEGADRAVFEVDGAAPRRWTPGAEHELTASVTVPTTLQPGAHPIALWLPDPAPALRDRPAYAIRLSNRDMWRPGDGANVLGAVHVVARPLQLDSGRPAKE